ncbi:hypothetical protein [Patulibacter defluvii]|uniref:hypothetical protein n=1 Tax=Patulibacter defluvii TaxID=3095358 RepID=UPI002A763940|nr:hypothetical protein [Patulibacter sp. DM4]
MKSASVSASAFRGYVRDLSAFNDSAIRAGGLPLSFVDLAREHLDGRAGRELRASVDLDELRRMGAFFTGDKLAATAVALAGDWQPRGPAHDPACGCGDLLLAAAWKLPVTPSLCDTLSIWNTRLSGRDLVPEFIEVAHQRLALLAMLRGARPDGDGLDLAQTLVNIRVGDGRQDEATATAGTVLLNPPYGKVPAPDGTTFAEGVVTDAALWTAAVLRRLPAGAQLIAVLPDVLRSGSRYARFRQAVGQLADVQHVQSHGQFDALTDVDVFLLRAQRQVAPGRWPAEAPAAGVTLGEVASISVGPVVDRRDPHLGQWAPYITTRELPQDGVFIPTRNRRFAKRLFQPPFVVVRRTSRPSTTAPRLRAVVIGGNRPVAVENHLIVIAPDAGGMKACETLAVGLAEEHITAWLDQRIRCRHLTVAALRDTPAPKAAQTAANAT